jgi:tetratricopeptide (TPR) repeat protein
VRTRTLVSTILLAVGAGGLSGYFLRAQKAESSLVVSVQDVINAEYLAPPDTFSRIKNTRNALDSLSTRVQIGISDALMAYKQNPRNNESEKKKAEQVLERAIQAGEAAMQEFEGTGQQLGITHLFLRVLREAGQFNRWLEVYTSALYIHPTDLALCHLAGDAVKISRAAGQQQQVIEALRYALAFPADFAGRAEVQAALTSAFASVNADAPTG